MLELPLFFTGCSNIQFSNSPFFLEHSQLGHITVQRLCDLRDAILLHWLPSASYPTLV